MYVDEGDKNDKIKWDITEDSKYKKYHNGYIYKYYNNNSLNKLIYIRNEINRLTMYIYKMNNYELYEYYMNNVCKYKYLSYNDFINQIKLFLYIHLEYDRNNVKKSLYLLSEMPPNSNYFSGLNKPKDRYLSDKIDIGTDKKIRATYRDIFLDLKVHNLKSLVIHELSHTMANHVLFRVDDHNVDFKICEDFLEYVANNINFMSD